MKAIRVHQFGGPDVLKLEDVPDPSPGPGQVVVRLHAAGVNPVETYIRSGAYARKPPLPYTPGADGAGTIESVGPDVTRFKRGDRVYVIKPAEATGGTYAQLVLAAASHVFPLPEKLSFAQGAAVGIPYGTAYRALFDRARALPGETVLVHGATGGVGSAAVELAVAHGMSVIGTGGTEQGRKLVRDLGAHHVLDHRAPGYLDELMKITDGKGVDVILEMLANVNLGKDLMVLAQFGRVVVIGNRGSVEIDARNTMGKESSILGMSLWAAGEAPVLRAHAAIAAGLANGALKPTVGREMPLADAPKAHEAVMKEPAFGKIVLVP
jgi:NADPH2:quinone reductase